MKRYWQRLALKIDALTLRERAIIFTMAALILIVLVNTILLDPQYARQKELSDRIKQEQSQIASAQAEIQRKIAAQTVDPDSTTKIRLQQLKEQFRQMQTSLRGMQKGLVSPDRMSSLLEDILKRNGRLRLLSLKTLPVTSINDTPTATPEASATQSRDKADGKPAASPDKPVADAIYRHGVEIVVQGGYLDLLDYLSQLEAMPWQLFWGKAKLDSEDYPKAKLTLTLYTLSLDKKWLNI
ncbi:MSHA biogenesis protein MshJ [Noviherbaspirillum sp.]|uniref:MSHA biogenesis protein MshJ n=1 Tax=Noviherbaspirillum sp. TaxID=1926288 RepID=UPI002B4A689F|nr:MSHA biogenesis protein MshJ [Noviherbaspirillum sp.]HJV83166.1 MSHA biogenesis protein MshJ [Noviherbaspirillum sp.]